MTEIEKRLVNALWLHHDKSRMFSDVWHRDADYRLLHRLVLQVLPEFTDEDRQNLVRIAWKNRAILPGDLAVAAALKGGIPCDD